MGRRHAGHRFMPGMFVFPGGRLERSDGLMKAASELRPEVATRLSARVTRPSDRRGRALALTAIRETYEETGLLIGRKTEGGSAPGRKAEGAWHSFHDAGILPDLEPVVFLGRAITPPRRPKRFDTRFFLVDRERIQSESPGFVGPDKELVELVWVNLEEAQDLELPRITSIMLKELGHRLGEGLDTDAPVPFYREARGQFLRELL